MKKLLCPQCKIGRFRVFNEQGESAVVEVSDQGVILPIHPGVSLFGYNLAVLHCLGCSWKGSKERLCKH